MKIPWINHPRTGLPDTMLSLSVLAFLGCLGKFLLNGIVLTLGDKSFSFGTIDAALIGALLAPTLVAYCARKFKDSPDKELEKSTVDKKTSWEKLPTIEDYTDEFNNEKPKNE